jgi:hypothetical protein
MRRLNVFLLLVVAVANLSEVALRVSSHHPRTSSLLWWWVAPVVIGIISLVLAVWVLMGSGPLPTRVLVLYFIVWGSLRVFLQPVGSVSDSSWTRVDLALFLSGVALFTCILTWQYSQKRPNDSR